MTKLLLSTSAVVLGALGIACSFAPHELLAAAYVEPGEVMVLLIQLLGAALFALSMVNWISRGSLLGGIYNRPVVVGNVAHFLIGAIVLVKATAAGQTSAAVVALAVIYSIFAIAFAMVMFRSPVAVIALMSCTTLGAPAEGDLTAPDGVKLHYRIAGSGPPIVLLHGGPGSNYNAVWPDLEPLANRFTVIMYDQRGGGRSQLIKDASRLTAQDHVRDLEAVREHFRLKRMTLVGESWGSALALLYASAHPDRVHRILFVGPMPPTKAMLTRRLDQVNETTAFYQRLAEMRRAMPSAPDPIALCREMFAAYLRPYFADPAAMPRRRGSSCDAPAEGVRNYQTVNDATFASLGDWDFLPLLGKLRVPALVIEGAESRPTIESVRAWADALPGKPLVLIPNAGHFPQVEQPELFFPLAEEFLGGQVFPFPFLHNG